MLSRVGGPHPQVRVTDREEADGWISPEEISPEEETLKISPEEETQLTENKKSRCMQLLQPGRFNSFQIFLFYLLFII